MLFMEHHGMKIAQKETYILEKCIMSIEEKCQKKQKLQ